MDVSGWVRVNWRGEANAAEGEHLVPDDFRLESLPAVQALKPAQYLRLLSTIRLLITIKICW